MKIFSHVTELGNEGYKFLPVVLPLSTRTTVWSPSSKQINDSFRNNEIFFRPGDILELVEEGHLKIMGREAWLTNPDGRRNHPWKCCDWDVEFDGKLCDMAISDKNLPKEQRRVILVPPERGYEWAEKVQQSRTRSNIKKCTYIGNLIRDRSLPAGVLNKVDRCTTEREKIRIVLRDMRNHWDAYRISSCDTTIDGPQYANCLCHVLDEEFQADLYIKQTAGIESNRVIDLLDTLLSISKPRSFEDVKKILISKKRQILVREFSEILKEDLPIASLLSSKFGTYSNSTQLRQLIPKSFDDQAITLASLVVAAAGFEFTACATLGLLFATYPLLKVVGQKYSWLPLKSYQEWKTPFLLTYGKATPTYKQIMEMHNNVREYMSSPRVKTS